MIRCAILILGLSFALNIAVRADELHLKDGRVIEAEEIWEMGDFIWYRQGKITASVAKSDVVKITKPKLANIPKTGTTAELGRAGKSGQTVRAKANAKVFAAASELPVEPQPESKLESKPELKSESGSADEAVTRKIARVVLKGGTQIDADSVWETDDRVGYSLGKMQTFVDRADVQRIIRDVTVIEASAPTINPGLRYTTGNRGLDNLIAYNSQRYNVDPTLIYLVMREESGFNHRAVSRVGARGLMQLMPATAARLGVRNIHDPVENVDAGVRYLRSLIEMFNGDMNLTLAAYNAGEGAVLKYGNRIPPYRETMNYVWRINTAYRRAISER